MYKIKQELPNSSLPKQGENVTWFSNNVLIKGTLKGYDSNNEPIIISQFDIPNQTNNIFSIRPTNPNNRIEPNWNRLPDEGTIISADAELNELIQQKLSERIPPGPSYFELMNEMYQRGYETYLVGGTVRDFIQGDKSNDIDMVTTMPLKSALPLIRSMFGKNFSPNLKQGFIRVGGSPGTGEPFIDIKNFWLGIGSSSHIYGSEIIDDYKVRDFACNSLYYDPINSQIIDPSGIGIDDAKNKRLSIVKDLDANPNKTNAQILVRFIKFSIRGYTCSPETLEKVKEEICPLFSTMTQVERMDYISRQIINKSPLGKKKEAYNKFVEKMHEFEISGIYEDLIKPYESVLNL